MDESVYDGRLADVLITQQHDFVLGFDGIHSHVIGLNGIVNYI